MAQLWPLRVLCSSFLFPSCPLTFDMFCLPLSFFYFYFFYLLASDTTVCSWPSGTFPTSQLFNHFSKKFVCVF